jgi:hypothetical protein
MKHFYTNSKLLLACLLTTTSCVRALQADEMDESAITVRYQISKNQVLYRKVSKTEAAARKLSTINDTIAAFTNGNQKLRAFVYKEDDEKFLYVDINGNDKTRLATSAEVKSIRIRNFSAASKDAKYKSSDVAQTTEVPLKSKDERQVHLLTREDIDSTYFTNIKLRPDKSYKVLHLRPFRYSYNSLVLIPLTIPLKFRFRTQGIPSTVETDFNAGALVAYRHGWRKFKRAEYREGIRTGTQNRHLTVGLFSSVTPITQTPADTEGLPADRTVAAVSGGIAGLYGFERVTIGLAGGIDFPFSNSSQWAYRHKPWIGTVVGIDLFK